jgi:hypothetical protein
MSSGATSGAAAKRKRPFQKVSASVPAKKSGASKRVVSSDDDDDDEIVPDSSPPSPARESVNKGKGMGNGKVGDKKKVPEESPGKKRQAGDGFATSSPRSKSPKKKETETPGRASAFGTSCSKSENKKPSSPAPAGQMVSVPNPPNSSLMLIWQWLDLPPRFIWMGLGCRSNASLALASKFIREQTCTGWPSPPQQHSENLLPACTCPIFPASGA